MRLESQHRMYLYFLLALSKSTPPLSNRPWKNTDRQLRCTIHLQMPCISYYSGCRYGTHLPQLPWRLLSYVAGRTHSGSKWSLGVQLITFLLKHLCFLVEGLCRVMWNGGYLNTLRFLLHCCIWEVDRGCSRSPLYPGDRSRTSSHISQPCCPFVTAAP